MTKATLEYEINSLPKYLQDEVADFVAFLKKKKQTTYEIKKREFGFAKGKISLSKDFDAPLELFKDYL